MSEHIDRTVVKTTLPAVVQIVALKKGFLGNFSSAWTGSGTVVDPKGYILTNCHVANPRAMGMPAPPANALAISINERSDEPPVITYYADIVVQSPELDLAVLKINGRVDGKSLGRLNLPHLAIGDSDELELGDIMSIFGYPGIGGETITFTSGSVAGFTKQRGVSARRAWIKTDATIAGGNSGGTAVDHEGKLVGIPTQAAAGEGISPVDARPVVDTNRDGRVDQRDTPMAIGGFINGLRPVNLAKPLLQQAGIKVAGMKKVPAPSKGRTTTPAQSTPAQKPIGSRTSGVSFSNLLFSTRITRDGRPVNPSAILPSSLRALYAVFDFKGMRKGTQWSQVWAVNGQKVMEQADKWADGGNGRKIIQLNGNPKLPDGEYHLVLTVRGEIIAEGNVTVGRKDEQSDTQISGRIVTQRGQGINGALVIALKPGVRAADFVKTQSPDLAVTSTKTNRNGSFTFPKQLQKGSAYGLVVVARGYRDVVIEGALRIGANAPEKAEISPLAMIKG